MKYVIVNNLSRPLKQPLVARYCSSFLCRLRGLMFQRALAASDGLLLVDRRDNRIDSAIHMMFVNFDLAVAWINHDGEVVDTCLAQRWHPAYMPKQPAQYVLEMAASRMGDFRAGDRVEFSEAFLDR
jgi:uncharacterized membrane protein (UPF0127 family)